MVIAKGDRRTLVSPPIYPTCHEQNAVFGFTEVWHQSISPNAVA
jgi:hypothetical protein